MKYEYTVRYALSFGEIIVYQWDYIRSARSLCQLRAMLFLLFLTSNFSEITAHFKPTKT